MHIRIRLTQMRVHSDSGRHCPINKTGLWRYVPPCPFFLFHRENSEMTLRKHNPFTVLRRKACRINSGCRGWHGAWHLWEPVPSRTAVMIIMVLLLHLLTHFSARVNKQSSRLNITIHFLLENIFHASGCNEEWTKGRQASLSGVAWFTPSPPSLPTAHPHPATQTTPLICNFGKCPPGPSEHTPERNSLTAQRNFLNRWCTGLGESTGFCVLLSVPRSPFAHSLTGPYGQS